MTRLSLDTYWTIPRVNGLAVSPDGTRLVMSVQTLAPDGSKFTSSLWEIPTDGSRPPRRITYSEKGEGAFAFLPDGSLLFASARPDVTVKEDEGDGRLFMLPRQGGEARPILSVPGGIEAVITAEDAPVAVIKAPLFADALDLDQDGQKGKRRKETGTSGILFERMPIRYWDHDLGPRHSRLLKLSLDGDGPVRPLDLSPDAGVSLHEASFAISRDGATVVTNWYRDAGGGVVAVELVVLEDGKPRPIGTGADYYGPSLSPDGRRVLVGRETIATPEEPEDGSLWLFDLATGEGRDLLPGFDRLPGGAAWSPDGGTVWFTADDGGHVPLFRVDVETGEVAKVTAQGGFSNIQVSRDGAWVYALRSSFTSPPEVVRIDARTGAQTALPTPGLPVDVPGAVEELTVRAPDGADLHAWLVLPPGARPEQRAPLLLWIHGGPVNSWDSWSWRWCSHLMAERGYAVLMPDPALSSGYGRAFIGRGWRRWGEPTWNDLQCVLDEVLKRPELDAERTAAMGGSFGGYMANWIAGHTDRFKAIVSHAGIWALDRFQATTDGPHWWARQFGDPDADADTYRSVSPRSAMKDVRTPLLLIHGALDYRVPISEALTMYADLQRVGAPVKYLVFPDENHWILKPGNSRLWYETVLAFLDEHLLGAGWNRPELL